MGTAKDNIANLAIGATALGSFVAGLGQTPAPSANDLADSHDRDVARREISIADIRTANQPTSSGKA